MCLITKGGTFSLKLTGAIYNSQKGKFKEFIKIF